MPPWPGGGSDSTLLQCPPRGGSGGQRRGRAVHDGGRRCGWGARGRATAVVYFSFYFVCHNIHPTPTHLAHVFMGRTKIYPNLSKPTHV